MFFFALLVRLNFFFFHYYITSHNETLLYQFISPRLFRSCSDSLHSFFFSSELVNLSCCWRSFLFPHLLAVLITSFLSFSRSHFINLSFSFTLSLFRFLTFSVSFLRPLILIHSIILTPLHSTPLYSHSHSTSHPLFPLLP